MATTSPNNIYYPVSSDNVAPLETVFSTLAASVQAAFNTVKTTTNSLDSRLDTLESQADKLSRLPRAMASGQITYTHSAPAVVGRTATLPGGRFTAAPMPFANMYTGAGGTQYDVVRAYASTTSSLTIGTWTGNGADPASHTDVVSWLAVQN